MAKSSLFSTFGQGEHRVTSSMLAVFERIDLSLLETILAAAAGESSLQLVTFTNQPPSKGGSVPGGRISARFAYWFEVTTACNTLDTDQLRQHLANLGDEGGDERLFVVTPDAQPPDAITAANDPRLVWFSFRSLDDAIDAAVNDPRGTASEQTWFLLRELQALLVEDGLLVEDRLVDSDEVVVVAARNAYPEYLRRSVYVCQPRRSFRDGLTRMGFYAKGAIQRHLPRIRYREDLVTFSRQEAAARRSGSSVDRQIGEVIELLLADGPREEGVQYQVFLLSGPEDPDTILLDRPIINDTVTESGRRFAFVLGQRYVSLCDLTRPGVTVTSQLGAQ